MRLRKNDFIIHGDDRQELYLAKILEMEKTEGEPTWFTIHNIGNIATGEILTITTRKDATYFAEVEYLEVLDEESANKYLMQFDLTDTPREAMEQAEHVEPTEPVEWVNINDNPKPTDQKIYEIELSSGYFKNLVNTFDIIPEQVWPAIDEAINEFGQLAFHFLNNKTREKFINKKVKEISNFKKTILVPGTVYTFKNKTDEVFSMYYTVNRRWFNPTEAMGTKKYIIVEDSTFFKENYLLRDKRATETFVEKYKQEIRNFKIAEEGTEEFSILTKRENSITVTGDDLGKNWTNAITYYYFIGGKKEFKSLDLKTFETYDSLQKIMKGKNHAERLVG